MNKPLTSAQNEKIETALSAGRIGWRDFALIGVQLLLIMLVIRQYQIENAGFRWIVIIAFGGFLIHAWLPIQYRLPFFAGLSVVGTGMLLGPGNLAWVFAIGALLVGICHLPASFIVRTALLVAVGAVLAAQRVGALPIPWSEAIWPILGSMFMFRIISYFYDLRHEKAPTTVSRKIAYFFMLPNVSFPLFPVVDFKNFRRNYYDDHAHKIYQRGVDWILRGITHLILYRLVYYHLTLTPAEVTSPDKLFQYLATNFLLYLKVSGLFHLVVGMLYLFGFRLPETHNRYFLAAGFTDHWRRVNIYWKDFMQKVFYYPAIFFFKRWGSNAAVVCATIWVFLLTWFLHAYQWFWIRGTTLVVLQDILFWAAMGALVVVNSLYEIKHGRKRTLGKAKFSWRAVAVLTLKSYGTFWLVCFLWSFWMSEKLSDWLSLWPTLLGEYHLSVLTWPVLTFAVFFIGNIPRTNDESAKEPAVSNRSWQIDRAMTFLLIAVLVGISFEGVFTRFGEKASTIVHSLREGSLSRIDAARLERGYYEGLTDVNRFNSQLWETYAKRPANWLENQGGGLKRFVGGFAQTEMIPSFVYKTNYGTITTNHWGMRDSEYADQPGPNTFRAAILGASSVMGWGVGDSETFENLVEKRLNLELAGRPFARYELLNFGVQGYQPPQQLVNFERSMRLHPNAIIYIATGREMSRSASYLAEVMHRGIDIPYPRLTEIVLKAGVTKGMAEAEGTRRLMPYAKDILAFVYGQIADGARGHSARPFWVFMPQLREGKWQEETEETVQVARSANFGILRLDDTFKGKDVTKIQLAEWDQHPNVYGHQLIAEHLFDQLRGAIATVSEVARTDLAK